MLHIKMKVPRAGPDGAHPAGAVLAVDGKVMSEKKARELIKGGYAEEHHPKAAAEKPAAPKAEAKEPEKAPEPEKKGKDKK